MQALKVLGWFALVGIGGAIFVLALGWDAGALTQPLAETSVTSLLGAIGIWWIRAVSLGWLFCGLLWALVSIMPTHEHGQPNGQGLTRGRD